MSALVDFLRARLADDEAAARAAYVERWEQGTRYHERNVVRPVGGFDWVGVSGDRLDMPPVLTAQSSSVPRSLFEARAAHIARHDPARVLADVEAKRRIVDVAETCDEREVHVDAWVATMMAVRHLAAVYADHPDYRQEWKP